MVVLLCSLCVALNKWIIPLGIECSIAVSVSHTHTLFRRVFAFCTDVRRLSKFDNVETGAHANKIWCCGCVGVQLEELIGRLVGWLFVCEGGWLFISGWRLNVSSSSISSSANLFLSTTHTHTIIHSTTRNWWRLLMKK